MTSLKYGISPSLISDRQPSHRLSSFALWSLELVLNSTNFVQCRINIYRCTCMQLFLRVLNKNTFFAKMAIFTKIAYGESK